jgi:hypothetical protein
MRIQFIYFKFRRKYYSSRFTFFHFIVVLNLEEKEIYTVIDKINEHDGTSAEKENMTIL